MNYLCNSPSPLFDPLQLNKQLTSPIRKSFKFKTLKVINDDIDAGDKTTPVTKPSQFKPWQFLKGDMTTPAKPYQFKKGDLTVPNMVRNLRLPKMTPLKN